MTNPLPMKETRKPFSSAPRHIKGAHKGKLDQKALQVEGSFTYASPHPEFSGVFFMGRTSSATQRWVSAERLEKKRKINKAWRTANVVREQKRLRTWARTHVRNTREKTRKWSELNTEKVLAKNAKYRDKQRTNIHLHPAAKVALHSIYKLREELTLAARSAGSSDTFHVDHVLPLQHSLFSGLHAPWNLQILEASQNIRKSNKVTF